MSTYQHRKQAAPRRLRRIKDFATAPFAPAADLQEANAILRNQHRVLRALAIEVARLRGEAVNEDEPD